jgi:hypothetical protein
LFSCAGGLVVTCSPLRTAGCASSSLSVWFPSFHGRCLGYEPTALWANESGTMGVLQPDKSYFPVFSSVNKPAVIQQQIIRG